MGAPVPAFIPEPFAVAASSVNINFPIPATPPSLPNGACWEFGFPPITMQPEASGGLPPFGQDFNGILFTLSSHLYALQAGQPYLFSSAIAGAISGYETGALVGMADGSGLWLNESIGNATDPDNDSSAAGWIPGISYGIATLGALVGGTVTLVPSQWRRPIIVLDGVLTANLTVVFPNNQQEWLVVNNTTGSFSTTVKTAAGTGIAVLQGGPSEPVGIWGDGANIYEAVAPLAVATSIAPVPLTLVERDNTAAVFANYFNQSTLLENPAIGSVFVQNTVGDGYLRKISLANFLAQIAQGGSLGSKGWITLGQFILQWGPVPAQSDSGYHPIVFAGSGGVAFPNNCFGVVLSPIQGAQNASITNASTSVLAAQGVTKNGFNYILSANWNIGVVGIPAFYIAIGN